MNKKKLSVVMAGAMLATSVAPVLAAEVEKGEYSAAELGLLKKELRELLESKKFHSTDANLPGESVYYVTNGLTGAKIKLSGLDAFISNLKVGNKVYVWSEGFRTDEKGNYFSTEDVKGTSLGEYKKADFTEKTETVGSSSTKTTKLAKQINEECWDASNANTIRKILVTDSGDNNTGYYYRDNSAIIKLANGREIVLVEGSKILDFKKPVDKDGYEVKIAADKLTGKSYSNVDADTKEKLDSIVGFAEAKTEDAKGEDLPSEKLKEIEIKTGGYDLAVSDLYDGLMLTEKGHDFLNQIKYYDKVSKGATTNAVVKTVAKVHGTDKYAFEVEFKAVGALSPQVYTITGEDKDEAETLRNWLDTRIPKVDILAGANRYETAVAIAKEQALHNKDLGDKDYQGNIVLVNGNSLVDGLSAAPLASALRIHNTGTPLTAAPILLTEADALPKETRAYLKELLANKPVGNLKTTIHLVGGTSVLNKSLERELKSLGFDVVRYGGDNREETSLKVAEAIEAKTGTLSDAFLVGANGEADAMSIASVAVQDSNTIEDKIQSRPIIVSKAGGVSEDAIDALKGLNVTVVGGEAAVSEEDYNTVKAEAKSINRIAGANRQATNALVIEKYYAGTFGQTKNVIVAKDGQKNKMELVDALSAANLASNKQAPIVLATDNLSSAQINALELNAKTADTLYQVGNGVARDVVKTIAQRLGLAK